MHDQEIFVPIRDFEQFYEVSNHGRIRAVAKCNPHTGYCRPVYDMKLVIHTNKYLVVWLSKPGQKKQKWYVHRLVAIHFLINIDGKDFVNHKDKNRQHNHVCNLEWMTHQENMDHRDGKTPINNDEPF